MDDVNYSGQEDARAHRDGTPPSPNPKRPRVNDAEVDADTTPRGPRTLPGRTRITQYATGALNSDAGSISASSPSANSDTALLYRSSSAKGSSSKKRPRQSSPRKQTMLMVMEDAVEIMSFGGLADPPEKLDDLATRIDELAKGKGILSKSVQGSIREAQEQNRRWFRWVEDVSFAEASATITGASTLSMVSFIKRTRDELGPTPSLHDARLIWSNAEDCYRFQHFESQWNCAVHYQILEAAFQASPQLGFCGVTGVQIHPDYTRSGRVSHHNKKVDFCIFLKQDSPELKAAALQSSIKSLNQTDYPALLTRPIFFSIETKTPGDKWAEAVNQITAWLVAQWDVLDDQVFRAQGADVVAADTSGAAGRKPSAAAASGLVFLPGIIVQGHEWYFVAVTRAADGRTQRWEKTLIGTTERIDGVYKITAVLQLLGCWAQNEYWPWFQRAVLR
ncbi:uncharacterized protein GLRG_11756 [Colletotrichum graminicola M1.001]|uniref:PD-(D/E)XK nuclease-like domain-containing protein n=1 Tax=Colletotrichum graminicola (strain M1.001 / M2 / FGSC 10212) TaxID=645133 RepID=E3R0H3_COLGM|nr:uncharacterized protein GLRG_11756 [Colletotrichum graminicola M1.001]EFQ36611.1 hypothetical protein GLRG_11756 [Colletotrichum graminicola M1.001]